MLGRRLLSALVILPLAAAAIWYGSWVFASLLSLLCAVMCWEWVHLCSADRHGVRELAVAAAAVGPFLLIGSGFPAVAALVAAAAAAVAILAVAQRLPNIAILILGLPYVVFGVVSAGWLRADSVTGLMTVIWLTLVVIATDVGAYFVGRSLGGPKLAPAISPNKTWSGLLGGMACAGLIGLLVGLGYEEASPAVLTATSLFLAVVAQTGDLIESQLKRHCNAKDASRLIPGHGGFLDRFDGYLTVMPMAALMSLAGGGSPITWQ